MQLHCIKCTHCSVVCAAGLNSQLESNTNTTKNNNRVPRFCYCSYNWAASNAHLVLLLGLLGCVPGWNIIQKLWQRKFASLFFATVTATTLHQMHTLFWLLCCCTGIPHWNKIHKLGKLECVLLNDATKLATKLHRMHTLCVVWAAGLCSWLEQSTNTRNNWNFSYYSFAIIFATKLHQMQTWFCFWTAAMNSYLNPHTTK